MTISITTEQAAARAISLTINAIDTIAAIAQPIHQASQRAGRVAKPILRQAFEQIDWQEVLRITVLGIAIAVLTLYHLCRWAGPALIQASAALGRWYAGLLVDHESATGDPQTPKDAPTPAEGVSSTDTPEPQEAPPAAPAVAAASPDSTPALPKTTRKPRRRTRRQSTTAA